MHDVTAIYTNEAHNNYSSEKGSHTSTSEYQLSIYNRINEMISKYTDRDDMVWVTLSDECFARMQKDPAYESWVMDKILQACKSCSGGGYDSWIVLKFGAAESDFHQTSHTFPDRRTRERIRAQELEAKKQLQKKRKKQLEKKILEERWKRQKIEKNYVQLKILDHRMQVEEENKAILNGQSYYPQDRTATLYSAAKRRISAYEATFLYSGRPL